MATEMLPVTEARGRLPRLVKDGTRLFNRYILTAHGKPRAVLLSYDEYEGWLETLEIIQDPVWRRALAEAEREYRAGKFLSYEEVTGKPRLKSPRR